MRLSICWQYQCLAYLVPYARYWQLKCAWPWPLKWEKIKCKHANGKTVWTLYLVAIVMCHMWFPMCWECNYSLIGHRLRDNHVWTTQCTRLESIILKISSRTLMIWMKIDWRACIINMHTFGKMALLRPAVCSQGIFVHLLPVMHTYVRTSVNMVRTV